MLVLGKVLELVLGRLWALQEEEQGGGHRGGRSSHVLWNRGRMLSDMHFRKVNQPGE